MTIKNHNNLKVKITKQLQKMNHKIKITTRTEMISTDLECLGLPHKKPHFTSNLMLQELHRTSTSLLPLISIFIETVKLRFAAMNEKQ